MGSPVAFSPLPRPHFEASALAVSSAAVAASPPPAASSSESPHAADSHAQRSEHRHERSTVRTPVSENPHDPSPPVGARRPPGSDRNLVTSRTSSARDSIRPHDRCRQTRRSIERGSMRCSTRRRSTSSWRPRATTSATCSAPTATSIATSTRSAPTATCPRSASGAASPATRSPSALPWTAGSTRSRHPGSRRCWTPRSPRRRRRALVAEQLRARGLSRATVAIEGSFAPHRFVAELQGALPGLRLVEAGGVLEMLRAVKRPDGARRAARGGGGDRRGDGGHRRRTRARARRSTSSRSGCASRRSCAGWRSTTASRRWGRA